MLLSNPNISHLLMRESVMNEIVMIFFFSENAWSRYRQSELEEMKRLQREYT